MQQLRDNKGKIIALVNDCGGQVYIYRADGKMLGWYDKKRDYTYTNQGAMVGKGNQLQILVNG